MEHSTSLNTQQNPLYLIPCIPNLATGTFTPLFTPAVYFPEPIQVPQQVTTKIDFETCPLEWGEEEEKQLHSLVTRLGTSQWTEISRLINWEFHKNQMVRTSKQCKTQWEKSTEHRPEWTVNEDFTLLLNRHSHGLNWQKITQSLPGKNENIVKNRCLTLINQGREQYGLGEYPDDIVVAFLIQQMEEQTKNPEASL